MVKPATFKGGLTNTQGSCPGCGAQVPRIHKWSQQAAKDAYACPTCGTFEYATGKAELPQGHAEPGLTFQPMAGPRSATVQSVLDPVDCVQ